MDVKPEDELINKKIVNFELCLLIGIIIFIILVIYSLFIVLNDSQEDKKEDFEVFPEIEIEIIDEPNGDRIIIKHISGDPIDWTKYKVILTNVSDGSSTTLTQLRSPGSQSKGDSSNITSSNITYPYTGFNGMDYEKGSTYQIEIYNLKENRRVFNEDVICE